MIDRDHYFCPDDDDSAAWHQHELELQQLAEAMRIFATDPAYHEWLDRLNEETRDLHAKEPIHVHESE